MVGTGVMLWLDADA
jgi:hypothetical protein